MVSKTCFKPSQKKKKIIGFQCPLSPIAGQPWYSKTCLKRSFKQKKIIVFKSDCRFTQVEIIAECSTAILSTFLKLPFVIKTFVLSLFE